MTFTRLSEQIVIESSYFQEFSLSLFWSWAILDDFLNQILQCFSFFVASCTADIMIHVTVTVAKCTEHSKETFI